MTVLGLASKREVTRTSIRVRTAMAVQTREQGRYLGGRPPYGDLTCPRPDTHLTYMINIALTKELLLAADGSR